jgi:5-methylcytosine-specific restriction protein A
MSYQAACGVFACPRPVTARGRCAIHNRALEQTRGLDSDRHRGAALYRSARWRRLRRRLLNARPLCECSDCHRNHRVLPATRVHHIRHHGGDPDVFFDERNLQPVAERCHNRITAMEMRGTGK